MVRREPFVNRADELGQLEHLAASLGTTGRQQAALIGLRRIGKSVLTREFSRRKQAEGYLCGTMNCDTVDADPPAWMYRIVRTVLIAHDPSLGPRLDLQTPGALRPHLRGLPGDLEQRIESLFQEAEKKRPSNRDLINGALLLPQRLAEQASKPVVFCLDEFPATLRLKRKQGLGSLEGIVREVFEELSPDVLFVITGSAVRKMRDLLEGDVPLLTRVHRIPIGPFDAGSADDLVDAVLQFLGYSIDPQAREDVLQLAAGHPYYVSRLLWSAGAASGKPPAQIERAHVQQAVQAEIVEESGDIAATCQWIFDKSLSERAGEDDRRLLRELSKFEAPALLSDLLKVLGWDDAKLHRHVTQLARAGLLLISPGAGERLVAFADPVFATWVERESGHVAPSAEDTVAALRKRLQRHATQSGPWYESYVRVAMEEFRGQRWPGTLFGPAAKSTIILPTFTDLQLNPTGSDDFAEVRPGGGDVECDVYGAGDECWLVETKTEATKASRSDLETLERKAAYFLKHQGLRTDRLWFVALRGFNPEAVTYAEQQGVYITKGSELKLLWIELQKRAKARRAKSGKAQR